MPRPPRLELPAVPQHVIQRGNNRGGCFFGDVDRRFYLKCLAESATRRGCAVHAYVLMSNHVHLLVTPFQPGAVTYATSIPSEAKPAVFGKVGSGQAWSIRKTTCSHATGT